MSNYQLLLSNLPADWKTKKISELGHVISGGTPSRAVASFWQGDTPWLTPGEVSKYGGKYLTSTDEYITESGLHSSGANLLPDGSLLVTSRATLGARVINQVPMTTNQGFKSIVFHVSGDADYYFHFFSLLKSELKRRASGTTFLEISGTEFSDIDLPVPPENERNSINKILDTLDTQIRETESIIAKLQKVKQGLLHDLLTRGVDENGELRPSYEDAPELYKSSELGWIPKDWEVESIQNLLSTAEPAMRSGPFGSALLKSELVEKGIPLLGIDNVFKERFSSEFRRFVTPEKFDELSRYAVRENDLLITIMGTVGRCCLVPEGIGKALSSKHTWCISLDSEKYLPYLAMLQVNYTKWVLTHFSKDQQGGTMDAIRSDTLRNTPLPKPPIAEQIIIEKVLKEASLWLANEAEKYDKLKLKKSGLMDDLLTGKKRVTNLLTQQQAS